MPDGGKRLYRALRGDHEPVMVDVFICEETTRARLKAENAMGFSREFDPMLYFWPVDGQHCVVHLASEDKALIERLGKALLRDGALWVSFLSLLPTFKIHTRGDVNAFWRRRYGTDPPVGSVEAPAGGGR
jgi:hypothetical protein